MVAVILLGIAAVVISAFRRVILGYLGAVGGLPLTAPRRWQDWQRCSGAH